MDELARPGCGRYRPLQHQPVYVRTYPLIFDHDLPVEQNYHLISFLINVLVTRCSLVIMLPANNPAKILHR